jgi:hypothetical protein
MRQEASGSFELLSESLTPIKYVFSNIHLKTKVMKTIKVARILVITLIVGFISVFSTYAESPAAVSAKNIRQKFIQAVQNPEDLMNISVSGDVEVLFTVNEDGNIDIKKMESTSDEISNYVKDKITSVSCKDFVQPSNQYYKVKFTFKQD